MGKIRNLKKISFRLGKHWSFALNFGHVKHKILHHPKFIFISINPDRWIRECRRSILPFCSVFRVLLDLHIEETSRGTRYRRGLPQASGLPGIQADECPLLYRNSQVIRPPPHWRWIYMTNTPLPAGGGVYLCKYCHVGGNMKNKIK